MAWMRDIYGSGCVGSSLLFLGTYLVAYSRGEILCTTQVLHLYSCGNGKARV